MLTFKELFGQVRDYKNEVLKTNFLAIVITVISVPIPLLIPFLIDEVILKKDDKYINLINYFTDIQNPVWYIVIVFVATLILKALATMLKIYRLSIIAKMMNDITLRLRQRILNHLKKVSMSEYDTLGSGSMSVKFSTDLSAIINFVSTAITQIFTDILTLIAISVILLYLNWKLAIIMLVLNPIIIKFYVNTFKKVSKIFRNRNKLISKFNNSLVESLDLFGQIRVQNRENHFFKKVNTDATKVRDESAQYTIKWQKSSQLATLSTDYTHVLFQMLAIYFVLTQELSIGQMMAIFVYANMLMWPMHSITRFIQNYTDTKEALSRINEIFSLKKEPSYQSKIDPFKNKKSASIELKNITFKYENVYVFIGLNIKIEPGEKVAIVGQTGSGKTTLANIIMGLYPIDSGEIFYNGVELKDIGLQKIRENIGYVLQAPLLFNDTLRYNLTLGLECSDQELYKALEIAQMLDFVNNLPEKLDTIVGKNGTKLSGGQRQRLSIARVILDKPKVLIFDESTSSLDNDTEDRLLEALDEYIKDKTVITIAHRKTTIDKSERVINLEEIKCQ